MVSMHPSCHYAMLYYTMLYIEQFLISGFLAKPHQPNGHDDQMALVNPFKG